MIIGAITQRDLSIMVPFLLVGAVFLIAYLRHRIETKRKRNAEIVEVKSNTPTEEELLLAMSNTELLRELVRLQRTMIKTQQNHFRFARLGIFSFFLALFSDGESP